MLRSEDSIGAGTDAAPGDGEGGHDGGGSDGGGLRRRATFAESLRRASSRVERSPLHRSVVSPRTARRHTSLIPRRSTAFLCQQLGESTKQVTVLNLVVLGFFWISGGIFGNEELIQAAPLPYIFALCVLAPAVYSLPLAFMCTEMASRLSQR